jgi:methyl-accepting chemotaxis protein
VLSDRRKKQVVNRRLQLRFAMVCIAYALAFASILGLVFFLPPMIQLQTGDPYSPQTLQAADRFLFLHGNFWPVVLISLIAIGLHAIRLSHRLAGPLYRYKRIFRSLKEGKIPEAIHPRRGDYLLEETAALNQMLDALRVRLSEFREDQAQINESIREIAGLAEKGKKKEASKRIAEVTERGQDLVDRLDRFVDES